MADVYPSSSTMTGASAPNVDVTAAVVTPTDRVRWGPILAGLFTALSTLAVLGTLGAAIGLSAYDPGDSARNFGIGSGIWGVISMLLAFGIGGWLAARSAAVRGERNGLLNGAMVWAVAIPLLAYVAAGLLTKSAEVTAQAATADAIANRDRPAANGQGSGEAQPAAAQIRDTMNQAGGGSPADRERVADRGATSAWTTLVGLLLSLGAASAGGYLGARGTDHHRDYDDRNRGDFGAGDRDRTATT